MQGARIAYTAHKDTDRIVSINFELPAGSSTVLPEDLVAVLDSCFAGNGLDPVRKFVKHFKSLGKDCLRESQGKKGILGYGQAIAKFMGNPEFREILSISEGDVLGLDHLFAQYKAGVIPFQVMHRGQLDPKLIPGDHVYFEKIHGEPYFIGDFNRKKPTGQMDLAATVMLRDLLWADSEFLFVGPLYYWHDQYLSEIRTRKEPRNATLNRLLYDQPVPIGVIYGDVVSYQTGERQEIE